MKTWTIIIGAAEDFDSSEDLQKFVEEQEHEPGMWARLGMASFDAPEDLDDFFVTLIGRGLAFELGYSIDDTVSYIVSGRVE